jgi:hypothetical protein
VTARRPVIYTGGGFTGGSGTPVVYIGGGLAGLPLGDTLIGAGGGNPNWLQAASFALAGNYPATAQAVSHGAGTTPDWLTPANAVGTNNSTFATISSSATLAINAALTLTLPAITGKSMLSLSSVKLRAYGSSTKGAASTFSMLCEYSTNGGATWTALETFTTTQTFTATPREYDVTAAIGGDWSKLASARFRATYASGTLGTGSQGRIDSVQLVLATSTLVETIAAAPTGITPQSILASMFYAIRDGVKYVLTGYLGVTDDGTAYNVAQIIINPGVPGAAYVIRAPDSWVDFDTQTWWTYLILNGTTEFTGKTIRCIAPCNGGTAPGNVSARYVTIAQPVLQAGDLLTVGIKYGLVLA